jgi:hypothetical protein
MFKFGFLPSALRGPVSGPPLLCLSRIFCWAVRFDGMLPGLARLAHANIQEKAALISA